MKNIVLLLSFTAIISISALYCAGGQAYEDDNIVYTEEIKYIRQNINLDNYSFLQLAGFFRSSSDKFQGLFDNGMNFDGTDPFIRFPGKCEDLLDQIFGPQGGLIDFIEIVF